MNPLYIYTITEFTSPLGKITLLSSSKGLCRLLFEPSQPSITNLENASIPYKITHEKDSPTASQLMEYFEGRRKAFTIPLDINGTPFHREVWRALLTIPYGKTKSYGQIAQQIGKPRAPRAVGQACGANPIPIIIPCHRVLTSTGKIGGYTGGIDIKNALLKLEGVTLHKNSI
jgi:O-6-methylguanine DNA methyltransferase